MKFFKPTLVAVAMMAVLGCNEEVKQEAKAPVLDTEVQKQAYGLGASIGMYMQRNLEQQSKLGLGLDKELIAQGFLDSIDGKSVMQQEEIQALLTSLDQQMKTKQQEMIAQESEAAIAEGQTFLAENAKRAGVQVTASGIQYEVLVEADGEKPLATDTVVVHYVGTLLNGEEFDSSVKRGQPATFPLNRVIRGWTEGVQLMSVGAKYKFTIPSALAYGPNGSAPTIPGNAVLQFEIELLDIQKAEPAVELGEVQQKEVVEIPKLEVMQEEVVTEVEQTVEPVADDITEKADAAKEATEEVVEAAKSEAPVAEVEQAVETEQVAEEVIAEKAVEQ